MANDGGRAFPGIAYHKDGDGNIQATYAELGMTLRQWYAGMALQGVIASGKDMEILGRECGMSASSAVAIICLQTADAILKAEKSDE